MKDSLILLRFCKQKAQQSSRPYKFGYAVKDEKSRNDYSHQQESDGHVTTGSYRVALPDGRVQIVTYRADQNGYVADVKYEGTANHFDYKPAYKSAHQDIHPYASKPVPSHAAPQPQAPFVSSAPFVPSQLEEPSYSRQPSFIREPPIIREYASESRDTVGTQLPANASRITVDQSGGDSKLTEVNIDARTTTTPATISTTPTPITTATSAIAAGPMVDKVESNSIVASQASIKTGGTDVKLAPAVNVVQSSAGYSVVTTSRPIA